MKTKLETKITTLENEIVQLNTLDLSKDELRKRKKLLQSSISKTRKKLNELGDVNTDEALNVSTQENEIVNDSQTPDVVVAPETIETQHETIGTAADAQTGEVWGSVGVPVKFKHKGEWHTGKTMGLAKWDARLMRVKPDAVGVSQWTEVHVSKKSLMPA